MPMVVSQTHALCERVNEFRVKACLDTISTCFRSKCFPRIARNLALKRRTNQLWPKDVKVITYVGRMLVTTKASYCMPHASMCL